MADAFKREERKLRRKRARENYQRLQRLEKALKDSIKEAPRKIQKCSKTPLPKVLGLPLQSSEQFRVESEPLTPKSSAESVKLTPAPGQFLPVRLTPNKG